MKMTMSRKTKNIVACIMILIGVMMLIGNAAYAANREPMKDYEKFLLGYGFVQDEDDDTMWYFDGEIDGYRVTAFYDAYYDSGAIYEVNQETGEVTMEVFKWQPSELEMDEIASRDF